MLAKLDALGDGSTDSIYLGGKIVNKSDRTTGRPGRSDRHVVCLEFRNSRCDRSWGGKIGSGPGGGTAKSAEDSVRIVSVLKREFAELDALGDGSTDSIYLRDKIFSRSDGTTGRPGRSKRRVVRLGFGNSRRGRSRSGQIGSGPG